MIQAMLMVPRLNLAAVGHDMVILGVRCELFAGRGAGMR